MSHILLTGIAVLDIINHVTSYPEEDTEIRAFAQEIRRGGNASNTATVLSQLKHDCLLAATISDDYSGQLLIKDLEQKNIQLIDSGLLTSYKTPTSYITLNSNNGSRSIIHYRDLPELTFKQFDSIQLEKFDWFHFEGRNTQEAQKMMGKAHGFNKIISLELEKERDNIDSLIPLADLIFFSRPFAQSRGFDNARQCIQYFNSIFTDKTLVCTWGSHGAFAIHNNNEFSSPAFYPEQAIDTIGAGDTFIAGFIDAQLAKSSTYDSLIYACRLAGLKCSQRGFENLDRSNV